MKKTWETPKASVQEFEANEYVAACWRLACDVRGVDSNPVVNPDGSQQTHSENGCGNANNQYITDNNNSITVKEKSADQGWLDCTITNQSSFSTVQVGTYVEWTTSATDTNTGYTRTWHHHGYASAADSTHPNRS
ncbi:MAG: hypothetical protein MRZ63_08620 [Anaerostipes sp.]|nr:hypothetical protein [Anaerostipes sp.]